MEDNANNLIGFKPAKWWRAVGPDGKVWCETSSERELRERVRPGDAVFRLYEKIEHAWLAESNYSDD